MEAISKQKPFGGIKILAHRWFDLWSLLNAARARCDSASNVLNCFELNMHFRRKLCRAGIFADRMASHISMILTLTRRIAGICWNKEPACNFRNTQFVTSLKTPSPPVNKNQISVLTGATISSVIVNIYIRTPPHISDS